MTRPLTPEELGQKVIREIKKFERLAFGTSRTKGTLPLLAETRPEWVGPDSEIHYRLGQLQERMREFVEARRP